MNSKHLSLLSTVALTVSLLPSLSPAAELAELIVRFREPQNTLRAASLTALHGGAGYASNVDVVNAEEGVVKLEFDSLDDARDARARLLKSGRVLNIAANHLYRPQISYKFHDAQPGTTTSFLAAPFPRFLDVPVLRTLPEVELPPAQVSGADPLFAQDWAMGKIGLETLFETQAARSIIVAVTDTGVDYNHEDLVGAMWRKSGGDNKEVGYDFAQDINKPYDLVHFDVAGCMKDFMCRIGADTSKFLVNPGHGTHCAGHVAAVYNNGIGIRGVGAGAKIMALKFFYDVGHKNAGAGDDAAAIKSIDYAIKNGAKVISASWGGRSSREDAHKSELKQALIRAQKAGLLIVVAAGNDAIDNDSIEDPTWPASYELDNIITVAATDKNDALAEFSSYGLKTAHIGAPGVKILSTTVGGKYSDLVTKFTDADGKEHELAWDGTSMATPIVAGAVALVWSKHPSEDYRQIRARILTSARKVPGLAGKVSTGGVLNVAGALK